MKTHLQKVSLALLLTAFFSTSYAITVNVHSTSDKIMALGFKVNGSKHGGLGKSYEGTGVPKGAYAFGVRVKGKDVPCMADGKRTVKITKNSTATLSVNGGKCTVKVESE